MFVGLLNVCQFNNVIHLCLLSQWKFLIFERFPEWLLCHNQAPAGSRDIPGSQDFFKIPIPGFSKI